MTGWFRRGAEEDEPVAASAEDGELVYCGDDGNGLLLTGPTAAVAEIVDRLQRIGGTAIVASPVVPTEALAVFATGFADGATSSQYIRHTPSSRLLLEQHGAIPAGGGSFRSMVHDGRGIAGNLDWEVVNSGPERALAFQSAAIGLALRTAIKNVEVAVERVEDKVDHVIAMLRSERLGSVLGDRRTLDGLVGHLDAGDALTAADWSSVAALGPAITRDLEKLRAHLRTQLEEAESSWRPRQRAKAADQLLADELLSETLALLLVAEHNFSQWQQLRVRRIANDEPEHLEAAVRQAQAAMREHLDQDQAFLDQFLRAQAHLLEPKAIDVLAPFQSRALGRAESELTALAEWFAEQRLLEFEAADRQERPTLPKTVGAILEAGRDRVPGWKSEEPDLPDDYDLPDPGDTASLRDMTEYDFDPASGDE